MDCEIKLGCWGCRERRSRKNARTAATVSNKIAAAINANWLDPGGVTVATTGTFRGAGAAVWAGWFVACAAAGGAGGGGIGLAGSGF